MQNENSLDSWLFIANPMSGKILVQELLPKMSLANQIAGFIKVQYLSKKLRDQVGFLFTDKRHSFLQVSAIAFSGRGQVRSILAISQERIEL